MGKLDVPQGTLDLCRNAKYYRLTRAGKKQLSEEKQYWGQITLAITSVLEGA